MNLTAKGQKASLERSSQKGSSQEQRWQSDKMRGKQETQTHTWIEKKKGLTEIFPKTWGWGNTTPTHQAAGRRNSSHPALSCLSSPQTACTFLAPEHCQLPVALLVPNSVHANSPLWSAN